MLTRLFISNYALISRLEIDLSAGLTIITGETGAGKSIILGALSMLLGERADMRTVASKSEKTVVEATFDIKAYQLQHFFEKNDIDYDEHECIIRREISASGRSRSFVNDTPVSLTLLRELTSRMVDIHSQHSNMLLARPQYQLAVLDNLAGNAVLLGEYKTLYRSLSGLRQELAQATEAVAQGRAEEDYLRFQYDQLAALQLQPNEDADLEAESRQLANVSETKLALWTATNALNGDGENVLQSLAAVKQQLAAVADYLGDASELCSRIESAQVELKDISRTIDSLANHLVDDPARLQQVEQRLGEIYNLEQKHGVKGADALIELQAKLEQQLSGIGQDTERVDRLKREISQLEKKVASKAAQLTKTRRESAAKFTDELIPVAQTLGMKNLKFKVALTAVAPGANGADDVQFLTAFNKNQEFMPVGDTASGGEQSRLMLGIKSIIARSMKLPTIIFDEVDTGVSGEVASRIGEMMGYISRHLQVIAITHLPQVAAHAAHHLQVFKTDDEQSTHTGVKMLSADEHVLELARMLSGKDVNQAAIDNAKSLIESTQQKNV